MKKTTKTIEEALKEVEKYKFHPLCLKFSIPSEKRMDEMAKRMLKFGQYYEIIRVNEEILDGRIRLLLCAMAEIKPKFNDINLNDEQCAEIVTQLNMDRRHIGGPAERIKRAKEIHQYIKNLKKNPVLKDPNLKKLQEIAEFKEIARRAGSKVQTVIEYNELTEKAKGDESIRKSLDRLETGKDDASIERIYKRTLSKPKRRPVMEVPEKPTEVELRQEIIDKKEEIKKIRLEKHHYKTLYYDVKEIAVRKGFWGDILKELVPFIERRESPFPTPKQLREAGLL